MKKRGTNALKGYKCTFSKDFNGAELFDIKEEFGDPGGNRTRDNLIKSQFVCGLYCGDITNSYGGSFVPHSENPNLSRPASILECGFSRGTALYPLPIILFNLTCYGLFLLVAIPLRLLCRK